MLLTAVLPCFSLLPDTPLLLTPAAAACACGGGWCPLTVRPPPPPSSTCRSLAGAQPKGLPTVPRRPPVCQGLATCTLGFSCYRPAGMFRTGVCCVHMGLRAAK